MASVYKRNGKGKWYAAWMDMNGKQRTKSTGTTDKAAAERIAKKYEADAALRRDGVVDPSEDRYAEQGRRHLTEHLGEYHNYLVAKGGTEKHAKETKAMAERVAGLCQANHIKDLTASVVQSAINSLRAAKQDDSGQTKAGSSLRTCNAYLAAIKGFSRWLHRDRRSRADALVTLEAYNEDIDRKRLRRTLTSDELAWLIDVTTGRTLPEHAISGSDRAMLYRLAAGSGLRANELRSLTPESFDLDSAPPTVTVAAGYSKRRRKDVQPIRRDLADNLREWLRSKTSCERVFRRMPDNTARMLRADLEAAREAWINAARGQEREAREKSDFLRYINSAGEVFDFHAFRHTFVSAVVNGGASVKVAQELARHSTPALTIGRYSHARLGDLTGALESLPATCSTNAVNVTQNGAKSCDGLRASESASGEEKRSQSPKKKSPKSLRAAGLSDAVLQAAIACDQAEGTGLEPATPCGAPEFQSGSSPIRLPSGHAAGAAQP